MRTQRNRWLIVGAMAALLSAALVCHGIYRWVEKSLRASELIGAVYSGDSERVRLLLDHGADARAANLNGFTPLERAVTVPPQLVNPRVIELLLQRGADPNVRNEHGETILDIALRIHLSTQVIRILTRYGAKHGARMAE